MSGALRQSPDALPRSVGDAGDADRTCLCAVWRQQRNNRGCQSRDVGEHRGICDSSVKRRLSTPPHCLTIIGLQQPDTESLVRVNEGLSPRDRKHYLHTERKHTADSPKKHSKYILSSPNGLRAWLTAGDWRIRCKVPVQRCPKFHLFNAWV